MSASTPHQPVRVRHWLALLALVLVWGSAFLLTDVGLTAYSPSVIVAGRIAVGALLLLAVTFAFGQRLPRCRRQWGHIVLMAFVGNALPFSLIAWGQQSVSSGLAGILMAVMPLVVMLLAHRFADDRLTLARASGLLIAFAGVAVLLGPAVAQEGGGRLTGQIAILAGAICYAVNIMLARRLSGTPAVVAAASVMLVANLFTLPAAATGLTAIKPSLPATAALIALGVFSTALGSLIYFRLVASAGPVFLSLINYLIPVWAVFAGAVFLGERLPEQAVTALVLILIGIFVSQYRRRFQPVPRLVSES